MLILFERVLSSVWQTQHDFMNEWFERRDAYLEVIISHASRLANRTCKLCNASSADWRCKDCLGGHSMCRGCCQILHINLPFHKIEWWNGDHYEPDWLCNVGVVVYLGHDGEPCPTLSTSARVPTLEKSESGGDPVYMSPSGWEVKVPDCVAFTIRHTNGIHKVWVRPCACQEGGRDIHLLQLGLYPLSYRRPHSAFTFHMLDDLRIDNLECKVSIYHYHKKLRRLTCPLFPPSVPVSICTWPPCHSG